MTAIVDQFHDPVLASLVRVAADRPRLAALVSNFDINPAEEGTLPDDAFAWPEKRAYPVHSREHAALSRAYRLGVGGPVPAGVDQTIKEACQVYGVDEGTFERVKTAAAPVDDSDDYLLPDIRRLRVIDAPGVKVAETRLMEEGARLTPGHRMFASARLVAKAAFHGVKIGNAVRQMAGMTVTSVPVLVDWLEARHEAAPVSHKAGYAKLAAEVRRLPGELRDRHTQERLACAVEELDELAGLDAHWGRRLPDPVATVFNTQKHAGPGVMLAGQFVPMERLAAYPASLYSDVLGSDIVREAADATGQLDMHRLATVLATLPVDMQRVLVSSMG